jgi:cytoskeletal protein CcmA (bactofilin family)
MLGNGGTRTAGTDEFVIFIGKGSELKGTVRFDGSGRIDGTVDGKVSVKGTLTIGEGAQISNEVEGDLVIIGGNVKGKVTARQKVQILRTAVVDADIFTPSLVIEEGGRFNGNCAMGGTKISSPPQAVADDKGQAAKLRSI